MNSWRDKFTAADLALLDLMDVLEYRGFEWRGTLAMKDHVAYAEALRTRAEEARLAFRAKPPRGSDRP